MKNIDDHLSKLGNFEDKIKWLVQKFEDTYPKILNCRPNLLAEVERRVEHLVSDGFHYKMSTKLFWILSGISSWEDTRLKCKHCGAELHGKQVGSLKVFDFPHFCSRRCQCKCKDVEDQRKKTCLAKYGVDHPTKSEKVKAKTKKTNLERHGAEWFIASEAGKEKSRRSKLERHGSENYVNIEKARQTLLERTGYENPFSNPKIIEKMVEKKKAGGNYCNHKKAKQTRLKNNAGHYCSDEQLEKFKKTSLEIYGFENPMQSEIVKKTLKESNLKNFGFEWPGQCPEIQDKQRSKYIWNNIKFDSAPELAFYIWLEDNKLDFTYQPKIPFTYEVENQKHFYFPDFKVGNLFFEIKGDQFFKEDGTMWNPYRSQFKDESKWLESCRKMEAKHQCMLENDIIILKKDQYLKYLKYVEEKFGKDYLKKFKKPKNI